MSAAFSGAVDLSALKSRPAAGAAGAGPAASVPGAGPSGGESPYVVDVTEATFADIVQVSTSVPVLVDLGASWSAESQQLTATLTALAQNAGGTWILARVDADASPRVAQALAQAVGAQAIPIVIALAAGQPVAAVGPEPEPRLRDWIAQLLTALRDQLPGIRAAEEALAAEGGAEPEPEPEDPRFTAAEDALAAGDFAAAAAAYQAILDVEPGNADAQAALAQTGLLARVTDAPADALALADAAPDDVPAQCTAADVQVAEGQPAAAFDRLVATVRRTAGDDRTAAREHLLQLFGLFAPDDELVVKYRRALAAALY